jgi:hypothetical protein
MSAKTSGTSSRFTNSFEVPEVHTADGRYYDLLNQFDFRPSASNTSAPTTNAALATVNPAETLSFGDTADPANDKKFPKPGSSMVTKIEQYAGRRDLVAVDRNGIVTVAAGTPHIDPTRRKPPILPQGRGRLPQRKTGLPTVVGGLVAVVPASFSYGRGRWDKTDDADTRMMRDCSLVPPLGPRSPSSAARCRSRPASLLLIRRTAATSRTVWPSSNNAAASLRSGGVSSRLAHAIPERPSFENHRLLKTGLV